MDLHTSAALAAFEAEVGASLADYGDDYLAQAPQSEYSLLPPEDIAPLPWDGDSWRHALELDCDVSHTNVSAEQGLLRIVFVEVATPGRYELATSAGLVTLEGVPDADGQAPLLDGYETLEELETSLGLPDGSVRATLARYDEHAARGEDDRGATA